MRSSRRSSASTHCSPAFTGRSYCVCLNALHRSRQAYSPAKKACRQRAEGGSAVNVAERLVLGYEDHDFRNVMGRPTRSASKHDGGGNEVQTKEKPRRPEE
jgi:hypothetical protein